jgi:hypothetical protein
MMKTCLKVYLPEIFEKLHHMGVCFENLIYEQLTSFFAFSFDSIQLLRIWDFLFLSIGQDSSSKSELKVIQYLISIGILIFQLNKDEIMGATTANGL